MISEMNKSIFSCLFLVSGLIFCLASASVLAQQKSETDSYPVGNPLGLPLSAESGEEFSAVSSNVTVYGAINSAESCIYDPERELILAPSRGVSQNLQANDAWVSLIKHDGSVHTPKWIGIQDPGQRSSLSPPLVLNDPFGSDIENGILYIADQNGGTGSDDPSVSVVRRFDLKTGKPLEGIQIEGSPWINDLVVAEDGTIYTTQTGDLGENPDPQSWRVWKISPQGEVSVFARGEPVYQPNGIALDSEGNIVVANYGNTDLLTFSPGGQLLKTEHAAQPGSDGLVIMDDGTKYVSSVSDGGVSRIRPGQPAELIARNIPGAASMCYDPGANQLVVPMTSQSTLAFIPLD